MKCVYNNCEQRVDIYAWICDQWIPIDINLSSNCYRYRYQSITTRIFAIDWSSIININRLIDIDGYWLISIVIDYRSNRLYSHHATITPQALVTFLSRAFPGHWSRSPQRIPLGIHLMKIYPDWDTFNFIQGHVITKQPMRIVFRARETARIYCEDIHNVPILQMKLFKNTLLPS